MGTLEKIAEAGYRFIELANHKALTDPGTGFDTNVDMLKAKLDALGITVVGAHVLPLDEQNIDAVLRYNKDLGNTTVSIPLDFWPTEEDLMKACGNYNRLGEICRKNGMRLLFHNHYHEFQRFNGHYILDLIMAHTDPELLSLELDAYWTIRGALDPARVIREYGKRIAMVHEKDFPLRQIQHMNAWIVADQDTPLDNATFHAGIKPEYFTEIGDGVIKVQDVINASNELEIPYLLVEQDYMNGLTEFQSIARSMQNLKRMRGLEW
jgi:sugar phosphate isomerase/epimerase